MTEFKSYKLFSKTSFKLHEKLHKTIQKQPHRDVLKKRCSENMQQSYRRTPLPKCDFNKLQSIDDLIFISLIVRSSHPEVFLGKGILKQNTFF